MENKKENPFWELIKFIVISLIIVVPIRMFVMQPFVVSGLSMFPTFDDKEYLIVDELSYNFRNPVRGEVVIFKYPKNPSIFYIKRIIGLPGETVKVAGNTVTIINTEHPEGFLIDQPYIETDSGTTDELTLKAGEYFVMGDNRGASSDSRYWGAVPRKNIIGRAYLRLLPIAHADVLPGAYTYNQ
jgi:signal peptidase I